MKATVIDLCAVGICMDLAVAHVSTKDSNGVTGRRVLCCENCLAKVRERYAQRPHDGFELQVERMKS